MSTPNHSHRSYDDLTRGNHQDDAVDFGGIIKVGIGLVAVTIASYLIVWGVYTVLMARTDADAAYRAYPLAAGREERLPPEPRLQVNPKQDLADLRAYEADTLEHYAWIDKNNGVVRIPIEQAMKLAISRGLPSRPANAAAAAPAVPAPAAAARPQEHR